MAEPLVVNDVNQLPKAEAGVPEPGVNGKKPELVGSSSSMAEDDQVAVTVEDDEEEDENAPLIGMGECRICQEEDSFNNLESPCGCSGSLKVNGHAIYGWIFFLDIEVFLISSSCEL